jgi:hypothetical protein
MSPRKHKVLTIRCDVIEHRWETWNQLEEPRFQFERCTECGVLRVVPLSPLRGGNLNQRNSNP